MYKHASFARKRVDKAAKQLPGKRDVLTNATLRCVASRHPNDIITCRRKIPDKVLRERSINTKISGLCVMRLQ